MRWRWSLLVFSITFLQISPNPHVCTFQVLQEVTPFDKTWEGLHGGHWAITFDRRPFCSIQSSSVSLVFLPSSHKGENFFLIIVASFPKRILEHFLFAPIKRYQLQCLSVTFPELIIQAWYFKNFSIWYKPTKILAFPSARNLIKLTFESQPSLKALKREEPLRKGCVYDRREFEVRLFVAALFLGNPEIPFRRNILPTLSLSNYVSIRARWIGF